MSPQPTKKERDVEATMAVSRALVAIVARSFAEADMAMTLQQWRVLVIVGNHGPMTSGALAKWMEVHPSSATRACDTLVKSGLLDRGEDPADRRRTTLSLTRRGAGLVEAVTDYRRQAIAAILDQFPAAHRAQLARAMQDFADAAGDHPEHFVAGNTPPAGKRAKD